MSRLAGRSRAWLIITLTLAMLAGTSALPAVANTQSTFSSLPCPGVSLNVKLGTTTPVLLVHGFNEGPSVFTSGSPSLVDAITAALGSAVTPLTFDYHMANTNWVTDAAIGPQLAQCITWLANTSAKQGGPGKVIIVAHSMGGLAVRCAVDPACVSGKGERAAANPDLIGLVITLGTPNLGSNPQSLGPVGDTVCSWFPDCNTLLILRNTPAAKAMIAGSSELANLAPLPASIPVDAIAGEITFTASLFGSAFGGINGGITDDGDIAVPVASALAEAPSGTAHAGPGAKSTTINCGSIPIDQIGAWSAVSLAAKAPAPPVTCWHLTETTNPVWQGDITAAIQPAAHALSPLAPIDWNNRQYALTCDNIVQTPVNVAFRGGNATARGPGIGPYDQWDISIDQVAHGVLPSLGDVTAVLFGCSPQPSNFSVQELRVYRTADGSEVGRIPELPTDGGVLPGVYNAGSIIIANGHVSADAMFYGPGDSHASGPSVPGHLSWRWNGQEFVTDASQNAAASCTTTALASAIRATVNPQRLPGNWTVQSYSCRGGYAYVDINPGPGGVGAPVEVILKQQGASWEFTNIQGP